MPLSFNDFCFVLSLQAGVVAMSTVGFTLMVITFIFNLYAPNSMEFTFQICQYLLLYGYLCVMMVGFGMAFMGSIWDEGRVLETATDVIAFGTSVYILMSFASFVRQYEMMLYVCPEMRCPDHHWLQDSRWRSPFIRTENETIGKNDTTPTGLEEIFNLTNLLDDDYTLFPNEFVALAGNDSTGNTTSHLIGDQEDKLFLIFVSFTYTFGLIVYYIYVISTLMSLIRQLEIRRAGIYIPRQ